MTMVADGWRGVDWSEGGGLQQSKVDVPWIKNRVSQESKDDQAELSIYVLQIRRILKTYL